MNYTRMPEEDSLPDTPLDFELPARYLGLSRRQLEVFIWIEKKIRKEGISPTLQEIADAHKIHCSQAGHLVESLKEKGRITTTPNKSRSIALVEQTS